ncbi:Flp family type IVb pilin [Microvirga sp. BT688]|uniref:Flp family type IVb pilin n=1 Tax=Microvirga sp. TaxID=1873136 RepID=UPI0016862BF9|nr:Flp family type IVb pilin [Microvirga sp.]MBD2745768.1 Flp family type IVb pilin [Microvirga sp.]
MNLSVTGSAAAAKRFMSDENGLAAMEYGILAGLVAVVIIGAVTTLGSNLKTVFTTVGTALSTATAKMVAN